MLDPRIDTFLTVCQCMSFTAAAEELHITQPAVSQHIHGLEQLYGAALFSRQGRRLHLTPAGELLRSTASVARSDQQAMLRRMARREAAGQQVRFGVTLTIGEYVIAAPLARYLKAHPADDVQVRCGNTAQLLALLEQGEIDFALVEGNFRREEYHTLVYRTQPFLPVCAAGHRFTRPAAGLDSLLGERLLVREPGSGTREILERCLAVHNLEVGDFAHLAQVENMHTLVSLLRADCGISFLYQAAVDELLERGELAIIPLAGFSVEHDFTFLWNRGSAFSEEYARICGELAAP